MKKKYKRIYIAVFLAMCTVPMLLYPFSKSGAALEKRDPVKTPSLTADGMLNNDFSGECEAFLADRLPFRPAVLTAANAVKSGVFKSDAANVVTGRDGWIFCKASVADYMNTNALSDERLRSITVSLSLLDEYVTAKGGKFLFVPMPNKASVYSEFMPSRYRKANTNNLARLQSMLAANKVSHIDMLSLMNEKKSFGLYHKRDTHWNYYGALLGYYGITDAMGKKHRMYDDTDYVPKKIWRGDIDKMLYPFIGTRDYQYDLNISFEPFEFVIPSGVTDIAAQLENFMSDKEENDKRISTRKVSGLGNGSLYMVRDSFGRALLPFFIDNYDTTMFVRADYPDMSNVTEGTDMIYEIVERNINDLFRTAPLMPAPVRTDIGEIAASGASVSFTYSEESYGTRIYGEMSREMLSPDGRVYVRLSGADTSVIYEAFPVYEEKLLGGTNKYGFSLIADASVLTEGEYNLEVISAGKSYAGVADRPLYFSEAAVNEAKKAKIAVSSDSKTESDTDEKVPEEDEKIVSEAKFIEGTIADRAKVIYNGTEIAVGANINDLLEGLGPQAAPSSSAESCLTGKPILEYYYAGMTIQADEDGTIASIEISESLYPGTEAGTAGGLHCGSSREDAFAAFGETTSPGAGSITYEEDDAEVKVQVIFKEDTVNVILITGPGA